jgi:hypothetical protein
MTNYVLTQYESGAGGRLAAFSCAAWDTIDRRYHKFAMASCDTFVNTGRR